MEKREMLKAMQPEIIREVQQRIADKRRVAGMSERAVEAMPQTEEEALVWKMARGLHTTEEYERWRELVLARSVD